MTPSPHRRPLAVLAPPAVRRRAHRRAALRDEPWLGPGSPGWSARLAAERRTERRTYALVVALVAGMGVGGAIAWGVASEEPVRTADRAHNLPAQPR